MPSRGEQLPPIRKRLGQHFLSDPRILSRIVDTLDPRSDETVLEIGPGRGALTDVLRERTGRLIAIEYDRALAAHLRDRFRDAGNVRIVEADVLSVNLGELAAGPYALVGNVPYYITTPILFHALRHPRAARAVYLVQREVADRLRADAGSQDYGALSVNVQVLATAESAFRVPAGAFHPPPKVESAVVRIVPRANPLVTPGEEQSFREFVQGLFGFRRKQMKRALRELRHVSAAQSETLLVQSGIPADVRPETLTPAQFVTLFRTLNEVR